MARLSLTLSILLSWAMPARAHHSFAMFDRDHKIELEGTVRQYRYTSPHPFIVLEVEKKDGSRVVWNLEGNDSPTVLVRRGWSRTTLKPGDRIRLRIAPLRSGAPGGAWVPEDVRFSDGSPVVSFK